MGIVVRQSAKTMFVTYAGLIIGVVNTLWFFPLMLSEEQIGLTRILINLSFFFTTFASLGAVNIPVRYFVYFKDTSKQHNGFLFFLISVGIIGFIIFVAVFLGAKNLIFAIYLPKAKLLTQYYYYLIPFTFIVLFYSIFESYTVIQQKPVVPGFLREFLTRLLFSLGLLAYFYQLISFHSFINTIIMAYGLICVIIILYLKRLGYLFIKPNFQVYKSQYFKGVAVFAGFALIANATSTIIQNVDSLVLSAYNGLKSAGIYTISFFIASIIEIPKRSLSQSIVPIVSEANKDNDIKKLNILYKKSSINQLIIGGFIFLLIWCNIDNIFAIMPNGNIYSAGKWVVFFIGISKLFDMLTGINSEIIGTSKYYKFDLLFYSTLSVCAIIFNLILIPKFGLIGAALSTALAVFIYNTMRFVFILILMKIQPFSMQTFIFTGIILLISLISSLFRHNSNFILDAFFRTAIITITFLALVLLLNPSEEISDIIRKNTNKYLFNK
jgi:O-antigen/teichoic acid export membrane protein